MVHGESVEISEGTNYLLLLSDAGISDTQGVSLVFLVAITAQALANSIEQSSSDNVTKLVEDAFIVSVIQKCDNYHEVLSWYSKILSFHDQGSVYLHSS